ncbi:hypothetical protein FOCC_FOCC001619 [Frankliniella occidentalis]|nr:hypothetical protein FOCC_FOCC001619 [Frankliniella occidentalis]
MAYFGRCFVLFFSNFGYDELIRSAGRHFCDFLGGMDNIHSQIRFSYPRMKSPSMFVAAVDERGAVLVYRSKRTGFLPYFIGQLQQVAETFYDTELVVDTLSVAEWADGDADHRTEARLRLDFDNRAYMEARERLATRRERADLHLPAVHAGLLMSLFPFGALLEADGQVRGLVAETAPGLLPPNTRVTLTTCSAQDPKAPLVLRQAGEKLLDVLGDSRPVIDVHAGEFMRIRRPQGALFTMDSIKELQSVMFEVQVLNAANLAAEDGGGAAGPSQGAAPCILLKGQMLYLQEADAIVFLCSPLVSDLTELASLGLYLNDLNLHGLSREMVMEGWHQCARLELMCERAEEHSRRLEDSLRLQDEWRARGDALLTSMIPRSVADRLLAGQSALDTCQAFDAVTVLFCELLLDGGPGSAEAVAERVRTVNQAFSQFDQLLDEHHVYKVETVGMVYMVSGSVQLSAATELLLKSHSEFRTLPRGQVWVKGKGFMNTFWLLHGEEGAELEADDYAGA